MICPLNGYDYRKAGGFCVFNNMHMFIGCLSGEDLIWRWKINLCMGYVVAA